MPVRPPLRLASLALIATLAFSPIARADEEPIALTPQRSILDESKALLERATTSSIASIEGTLERALDLIGIRYRRGGSSPEQGFDCSGFVSHVFNEGLGLYLPRTAREMSQSGEAVRQHELKPGDLVFFNTMRRAFSHVGIYLGDDLFVHSPRTGGRVRVEDMRDRYWVRRFNGARRIAE
jgi:cell wall-associated NlpC family hydrolase